MKHSLSFEELDWMFDNHAPFLSSLSDGPKEELRIKIAVSGVEDAGENIPDLEVHIWQKARTLNGKNHGGTNI